MDSVLRREYAVAVAYMLNPVNEVSPQFCVGPASVARMVPDALVAWHAREHNQTHLGIEIAQPAYCPPFSGYQVKATAEICARWCFAYGLPADRVTDDAKPGIIAHADTAQGRRDGKTDPGAKWPWVPFITETRRRLETLRALDRDGSAPPLRGVGVEIWEVLSANPGLGAPAKRFVSPYGDEVVLCTATTAHPHGAWVIWRKWLDQVRVVSWDRPLEV